MKLKTKVWLIVATCLFILGAIVFTGALSAANWDFSLLSTDRLVTTRHQPTAGFQNISLSTVTADISILPATDGKTTVVCREWEKCKHTVAVKNGTLTIKMEDTRAWHDHFAIHSGTPAITIYLPSGKYDTITVKATTGDIKLETLRANAIDLTVTTGDISMKNVIAAGDLCIKTTTGDVKLDSCDGADITMKLTTGDVTGNLLTGKEFAVRSTTGHVDVPENSGNGKCQIRITTGNVHLTVK